MRFLIPTLLVGVLIFLSGLGVTQSAIDSGNLPLLASDESWGRNLEEEHESNGPEGSRGIPMQRLPAKGIVFVLVTCLASGAVVWRATKDANTRKTTQ